MKLSIITITYQDPKGLTATLDSLKPLISLDLAVKLDWEHLIIDSSPSISEPILANLPKNWPLSYLQQEKQGIYAAFNYGIENAKGQLIWFLNSGDLLYSVANLISALDEFANSHDLDLLILQARLTRHNRYQYTQKLKLPWQKNLLGMNQICHQSILYNRKCFEKYGFFSTKYKVAGDYEHHLRLFLGNSKVRLLERPLVTYDMEGSSSNYQIALQEFLEIHSKLYKKMPFCFRLTNALCFIFHAIRIPILKFFARSTLRGLLYPLWLKVKR